MGALAASMALISLAGAQSPMPLSRGDSVRLGGILGDFHRQQVVIKGKCTKPASCRHSVVFGPMAQSLRPFVVANLTGLPASAAGTDLAVSYFGLRVTGVSVRADTLVAKVDAIHRVANAKAWSEWEMALLLTRDRSGSLVLVEQRLLRISDVVPP
jgi:hypothetical protein